MIYYFYSNSDPKMEPISQINVDYYEDACIFFAERKQLTLDQFFQLYTVNNK